MKLPVQAPTIDDIIARQGVSWEKMFSKRVGPEVDGVYEHWDKVRHRPNPPEGLTSEEWWLGIKLARSSIARTIPLRDKLHEEFRVCLTDSMQRRLHYIDREAAGAIRGMEGKEDGAQSRYLIRSLIEESMTSSQLEGAATTRAVAKELLSTGRQPRDHSERMIYNNYRVMNEIRDWGQRPITPEAIMKIHEMLTADTLEADQCGRFRTAEDNVVIYDRGTPPTLLHVPPPAAELPDRLQRLCNFANATASDQFLHPVVRAIAIHFQIGYDHPFCDGNGRTARILFYWSMVNSGYWLTEYISISSVIKKAPSKYLTAYLYTESDERDLSYFIAQQLTVIEGAIEGLHAYIARKSAENKRAQQILRGTSVAGENLNHRQRSLLANAIHNPDREYTVATHQTAHRVTYPTALNDLNSLVSAGLLTRQKHGKAFFYYPVSDMADRLSLPRGGRAV